MALSHRYQPTYGVQFHPESILTQQGHALLANFLRLAETFRQSAIVPRVPQFNSRGKS